MDNNYIHISVIMEELDRLLRTKQIDMIHTNLENIEQNLLRDNKSFPHERVVIQKIAEKIRKAKILKETKNYTYDLGNAERLRGYIKALEELKHELSNFTV